MNSKFPNRATEPEVQEEILLLLSGGHAWTNAGLKRALITKLVLSAEDEARANERPNEPKWHEIVNNALSQSRGNSLPAKAYVKSPIRGEHQITDNGLKEVHQIRQKNAEMLEIFDKHWCQAYG